MIEAGSMETGGDTGDGGDEARESRITSMRNAAKQEQVELLVAKKRLGEKGGDERAVRAEALREGSEGHRRNAEIGESLRPLRFGAGRRRGRREAEDRPQTSRESADAVLLEIESDRASAVPQVEAPVLPSGQSAKRNAELRLHK
jgi:hypothetical protein